MTVRYRFLARGEKTGKLSVTDEKVKISGGRIQFMTDVRLNRDDDRGHLLFYQYTSGRSRENYCHGIRATVPTVEERVVKKFRLY